MDLKPKRTQGLNIRNQAWDLLSSKFLIEDSESVGVLNFLCVVSEIIWLPSYDIALPFRRLLSMCTFALQGFNSFA